MITMVFKNYYSWKFYNKASTTLLNLCFKKAFKDALHRICDKRNSVAYK